jgi:hypothetical protein
MAVALTYEFDAHEYYRASRAVMRLTSARWLNWGFSALAVGLAMWSIVPNWGAPVGVLLAGAFPWLLLAGFWLAFIPFIQRRAARKLPERDASVRGPQERIIDSSGLHLRGNGVALEVPWHAMVRGVETAQFFLFFYNKQCAHFVPKRTLSTRQIDQIREFMQGGLNEQFHRA